MACGRGYRCDMPGTPTLLEWMGGPAALERLLEVFYRRVPGDALLGPLFARMSPDHTKHVAAFVGEVFGGAPKYSAEHGGHANITSGAG